MMLLSPDELHENWRKEGDTFLICVNEITFMFVLTFSQCFHLTPTTPPPFETGDISYVPLWL